MTNALARLYRSLCLLLIWIVVPGGTATATAADTLKIATWNVAWLRAAPLSPSDLKRCVAMDRKAREQLDDRHPMRWVCRGADHYAELRAIAERVDADIVALQEVESVEAIATLFPPDRYRAFVTNAPWMQRTGFAVRKSVEVLGFESYAPLGRPIPDHPRAGADLAVRQASGKPLRLLGVHLKSACHARPLTDTQLGRFDKPGNTPPCKILGDQVKPLEEWIDARAREGVDFIVLGDFNRRLDAPVERDGAARDATGRQLSLWKEIDDGDPPGLQLLRVTEKRRQIRNCQSGDRSLAPEERAMFIDHIVLGPTLAARLVPESTWQWSLIEGKITRENRDRLRALSDHCPLSVQIRAQ